MEPDFPIAAFLEIKKRLTTERHTLEKEKAAWKTIRNTLTEAESLLLDEQFKSTFESLQKLESHTSFTILQNTLLSLKQLTQKGASASLLGTYELGTYNLAMFVAYLSQINGKEELAIAADIIRTTIIADADLYTPKAYVGNGGMNALGWLCIYLGRGVGGNFADLRTIDQYQCCYKIFPWIADMTMTVERTYNAIHPFDDFILSLRVSPEVADLQDNLLLQMICLGWAPLAAGQDFSGPSFFSKLAATNIKWLTMLYPFEHEALKGYIATLRKNTDVKVIKHFLNSFTSSNKSRKHFRTFFSQRPHWLLKLVLTDAPETVFNLVRRNEQDMLVPFLKHYKREIAALRDESNRTLLQHAMTSRGVVENTIQLLHRAGLPAV